MTGEWPHFPLYRQYDNTLNLNAEKQPNAFLIVV